MKPLDWNTLYDYHDFHSRGITGKGITVAVLDTGIYEHPDFFVPFPKIKYFKDFRNHRPNPYDDNGHGTHVSGIIASGNPGIGIAPEASIVALKVLNQKGGGMLSHMVEALDWILRNYRLLGIRIINISVGMPVKNKLYPENDILVQKVNALWDEGLVVVVAAGNEGPGQSTITSPGVSRKVITVGAMEHTEMGYTDKTTRYSGRGPVAGTCVCKPDLIAPGTRILSCANTGKSYKRRSGTSMATPVVSGVAALMLGMDQTLTNLEIKKRFMETCIDCGFSQSKQGWGFLNPEKLLYKK